jgi:YVTN family beta-propeller protein
MANRVKFTRDVKRVLISDRAANDVVVLDVTTKEVIKRLTMAAGPRSRFVLDRRLGGHRQST